MKARPLIKDPDGPGFKQCAASEATHVHIKSPAGCLVDRILPIIRSGSRDAQSGPVWTWNGSTDFPTLRPSVLSSTPAIDEDDYQMPAQRCHSWVNDGKIKFLADCTHAYAGQTLDLLDVAEWE